MTWPLPAILAWAAAWGTALLLGRGAGVAVALALTAGACVGAAAALSSRVAATPWRRVIVAGGFPVSLAALGLAGALPAWGWLAAGLVLLAAYPMSAWRDAPVFPTPRDALAGVPAVVALPPGAALLDAGCGLGHGLQALRSAWPGAAISGIERSAPLRLVAALRCPWATVRGGDMWRDSWARYDLVYLFQRPESMGRAWSKAAAEMRPGAWLVTLEFEVPGHGPVEVLRPATGRAVLIYRLPLRN
jgi:hypothetical protein